MNSNYTKFKFPQIKAHPWHKIFHKRMPPEVLDLVSRLLQYSPNLWSPVVSVSKILVSYTTSGRKMKAQAINQLEAKALCGNLLATNNDKLGKMSLLSGKLRFFERP